MLEIYFFYYILLASSKPSDNQERYSFTIMVNIFGEPKVQLGVNPKTLRQKDLDLTGLWRFRRKRKPKGVIFQVPRTEDTGNRIDQMCLFLCL